MKDGGISQLNIRPNLIFYPAIFFKKEDNMEAVKIIESAEDLRWNYDAKADVLYVSIGPPRAAVGVDIGEGTVLRYDESNKEVVGITLIGLKEKLLKGLSLNFQPKDKKSD